MRSKRTGNKTMASNSDLKCIENDLNGFKSMLKRFNLNEKQLNQLIDEVFDEKTTEVKSIETNSNKTLKSLTNLLKNCFKLLLKLIKVWIILLLIIIFMCSHCPTQRFILRNSQQLIYPVMRQLRLWTLPLIESNKELVGWDVEECLLENPLYGSVGVECWPCDRIHKASDLTDFNDLVKQYVINEKPFVVKNVINSTIDINTLVNTYQQNRASLEFGTAKVVTNCDTKTINNLKDLMILLSDSLKSENELKSKKDIQIEWKMNRVEAIRVVRKVFLRPQFVPKTSEVALQRYIFIDGPQSQDYHLPKTEFANVWLTQGTGYRHIVLEPSHMCAKNCSTFSVVLGPKDTLYYNWQLYRPRSLPIDGLDDISITFVASFY